MPRFQSSKIAFQDGFSINGDLDYVAHDDTALIKRRIPTHTEIMTIERLPYCSGNMVLRRGAILSLSTGQKYSHRNVHSLLVGG